MRTGKVNWLTAARGLGPAIALAVLLAPLAGEAWAQGGAAIKPKTAESEGPDLSEIIASLVAQLAKSKTEAYDAALKLGQMGGRAVPVLVDALTRAESEQVKYYVVLALSRVRDKSGAQALLPMLKNENLHVSLRLMAIDAVAGADLAEGVPDLKELAVKSPEGDVRFKALLALSVMLGAWSDCEELFTKGMGDERDDIRQLCAKVCYQAASKKIIYFSAETKLLELAEKDPLLPVRANALAALARMNSKRAAGVCIRVLADGSTPQILAQQALNSLKLVSGVPLKNAEAALSWWEKFGKERYENAPLLLRPKEALRESAAEKEGPAKPKPEVAAPAEEKKGKEQKKLPVAPMDEEKSGFRGAAMGE